MYSGSDKKNQREEGGEKRTLHEEQGFRRYYKRGFHSTGDTDRN